MTRDQIGTESERGATLIVLLLTINFIALTFGALLNYQSTALNAQTALADRRNVDLGADAALDAGIAQLEANGFSGKSGAAICGVETSDQLLATWQDPDAGPLAVWCRPAPDSANPATNPRHAYLTVKQATNVIATAEVKIYSLDRETFTSIEQWDRATA